MTADVDTAGTAASPVSSRRGAAGQNGAVPVDLHELQQALEAMRGGDFSVRLPTGRAGAMGRISVLFNEIVGANQVMTAFVVPFVAPSGTKTLPRSIRENGFCNSGFASRVSSVSDCRAKCELGAPGQTLLPPFPSGIVPP